MQRAATIIFVVVTALACVALVWFLRMGWTQPAAGVKLIASAGYIATAISAGVLQHRFGRIVLVGLALSLAGDLFLIGLERNWFLLGLVSFLLAHIAYTTAFITRGQDRKWVLFAAPPVIMIAILVLAWLAPHVPPELAMPVRIYTAVISVMVIAAFGARGAGASSLIAAGALMFFASDISVAAQRILETDFPTIVWGLPLYYGAQLCLGIGAGSIGSRENKS